MKLVVPIDGPDSKAGISRYFARSTHFAIVDQSKSNYEIIENPFNDFSKGVGVRLFDFLIENYQISKIVAFELGLKVQQLAIEKKLQLIILNGKNKNLKQLLKLIFPNDV